MTKREKEILAEIVNEIQESDDKIDVLERLYIEVKRLVKMQ